MPEHLSVMSRLSLAASLVWLLSGAVTESARADAAGPTTPRIGCSLNDPMGQPAPDVPSGDWQLRQEIAAILGEQSVPGAAVIAVRGNEIIFEMYSGCRSALPDEQWPVEKDTTFLLASVSKTLTAVTVLHLADKVSDLEVDRLHGLDPEIKECLGSSSDSHQARVERFLNCPIEVFSPGFVIDFPSCKCPDSDTKCNDKEWKQRTECPECQGCVGNPCPRPPTVRFVELLDHTSGIVDVYEGPLNCIYNLDADSPMTVGQMAGRYLNKKVSNGHPNDLFCMNVSDLGWSTTKYEKELYSPCNFGPYGVFKYSNSGYTLLGYMVERVLAKICPLLKGAGPEVAGDLKEGCAAAAETIGDRIEYPMWKYSNWAVLDKLGMTAKGELAGRWLLSELDDHAVCVDLDRGKHPKDGVCRIARPGGHLPYYNFPGYPNGGFRCTARALSRFLRMLMNDGAWGDHQILAEETARGIWNFTARPWPWQSLTSRGFSAAALGFALQAIDVPQTYNGLVMGHTGGEMGVATYMFWLPVPSRKGGQLHNDTSKSLGVLVVSNGELLGPEAMVRVFERFQGPSIPGL